jgi:ribosomal protein L25 (general stress protein Ctc)
VVQHPTKEERKSLTKSPSKKPKEEAKVPAVIHFGADPQYTEDVGPITAIQNL